MKYKVTKSLRNLFLMMTLSFISIVSYASPNDCMAKAMYFEARGGSEKDMLAVGHTIMNRFKSSKFPNSICAVTNQKSQYSPHIRNNTAIKDWTSYNKCKSYASKVINGKSKDFTKGATYFHTPHVNPSWSRKFKIVYRNNQHIFYKP